MASKNIKRNTPNIILCYYFLISSPISIHNNYSTSSPVKSYKQYNPLPLPHKHKYKRDTRQAYGNNLITVSNME